MNHNDLVTYLSAKANPLKTTQWLREEYFPMIIDRFNSPYIRKSYGLYQGERIPDNERNLTDVRNRISILIENELARLSNSTFVDYGINDIFWSYVVANRFPDLEVRQSEGIRYLRFEVKCLQSIAEEKSANFDTLKKDINPKSDFIIVFLWEWSNDGVDYKWDRAPKLLKCFVFHGYSLAELRDCYWLNRPPSDLGNGFQGFDLRYAVNCKNNIYAEEEGNYGKLLRIWKNGFPYHPSNSELIKDTKKEYLFFQKEVILQGFWTLCNFHLPRLSKHASQNKIYSKSHAIGEKSGDFGFFLLNLLEKRNFLELMMKNGIIYGVFMTDKYVSTGFKMIDNKLIRQFNDLKPKHLNRSLFGLA